MWGKVKHQFKKLVKILSSLTKTYFEHKVKKHLYIMYIIHKIVKPWRSYR